jgi:hypothetical protein
MNSNDNDDFDGEMESTANREMKQLQTERLQTGQGAPLPEPPSLPDNDQESPGFDPYDTASLYIK